MIDVFHHLIHEHTDKENERYRAIHKKKWIIFIDKYIYLVAMVGIVMTLPQVYDIWFIHKVAGVSAVSWATYGLMSIIWIAYGLGHKEKVITYSNIVWVFLDFSIVAGVLIFR
jgi:hypothetical protein